MRWLPAAPKFLRSRYNELATGWTFQGSNHGGGDIFWRPSDRSWGPPSLLYNEYQASFLGTKRPGRGVDHPPLSGAEVKERVELYLYFLCGHLWPALGRNLPFLCVPQSLRTTAIVRAFFADGSRSACCSTVNCGYPRLQFLCSDLSARMCFVPRNTLQMSPNCGDSFTPLCVTPAYCNTLLPASR